MAISVSDKLVNVQELKEAYDSAKDLSAGHLRFGADIDTWGEVYNILSGLPLYKSAAFSVALETSSLLTGGGVSSLSMRGVVCKTGNEVYDFVAGSGTGNTLFAWRISGFTSASTTPTVGTVNRYYGATSYANLKSLLGLGTEAMNFRAANLTGTDQAFGLSTNIKNQNNLSRLDHLLTFAVTNTGVFLYDNTTSETVWNMQDAIHKADTDFTSWNDFTPKATTTPTVRIGRTSAGNGTNTPLSVTNATWYGMCFGYNSAFAQMAILVAGGTEDQRGRIYTRNYTNSTWSAWRPVQMSGGGWLADGTDLDDMIYPGSYGLSAANTYPNRPTGFTGGILTVVNPGSSGSYCIQRLETTGAIYVRYRNMSSGTAFGSWYKYTGTAVT